MKKLFCLLSAVVATFSASNVIVMWSPVEGVVSYDIYCRSVPPLREIAFNTTLTNSFFDVRDVFAEKPYGTYEMTISHSGVAIYTNLWVPWYPLEAIPKPPKSVELDIIK